MFLKKKVGERQWKQDNEMKYSQKKDGRMNGKVRKGR